jgi:hypothetical protein
VKYISSNTWEKVQSSFGLKGESMSARFSACTNTSSPIITNLYTYMVEEVEVGRDSEIHMHTKVEEWKQETKHTNIIVIIFTISYQDASHTCASDLTNPFLTLISNHLLVHLL